MNKELRESILNIINHINYAPLSLDELQEKIDCKKEELENELNNLVDEYEIFLSKKKDKYLSSRLVHMYKGTISIKNNSYGFVSNDFYPDVFVPGSYFNNAMNKDYVLYRMDINFGEP